MGGATGRSVSVNVGRPVNTEWQGRSVTSAIPKAPVGGPRHVAGINVEGDDQADRRVHGGPTKSVHAYAAEDHAWSSEELGRPLGPGSFGDNLTIEGLDPGSAVVGERWRAGGAVLRVAEPLVRGCGWRSVPCAAATPRATTTRTSSCCFRCGV